LAADGCQRYLCRDCSKRSREQPRTNAYSEEEREQILRASDERSSVRGLSRTFGISRNTVTAWIRKR
jgi:transposase-like protein